MAENEWVTGVILLMDKIRLISWYAKCPYVLDQEFSTIQTVVGLGSSEPSTVPLLIGVISSPFITGFRAHLCRRCVKKFIPKSKNHIGTVVGNSNLRSSWWLVVKICVVVPNILFNLHPLPWGMIFSYPWHGLKPPTSWMIILCSPPGSPAQEIASHFFSRTKPL